MKTSFMTFACPQWTAPEVVGGAARHGYDGIEWRVGSGHAHGVEVGMPAGDRAALRGRLADMGIESACLATSLQFVGAHSVTDAPALLDLAAAIGAPGLRVFCGPLPDGLTLQDAVSRCSEHLLLAAPEAEARGVGLWLETHDTVNRGAPVAAILDNVRRPAVAANWDNMHPYFNGEPWDETQRVLHGRVAHTHFHDALGADPATIVPFGRGRLPCAAMVAWLREEGYAGYLSGEWFNDGLGVTPDEALSEYIYGLRRLLLEGSAV